MDNAPSIIEQIAQLAPTEILSGDSAADLFSSFEADLDLAWDRSNITVELVAHGRRALKWAMLAAAAEHYVADLDLKVRDLRARLDQRSRQAFTGAQVKFTEAMVTASIDSDPEWQSAQRALHEAESKARILADVRDLFRQRKDLLVQDALLLRAESPGGDPVVAVEARERQRELAARARGVVEDEGAPRSRRSA